MFIREIKNAVRAAANSIFPRVCIGCGEIIDNGEYFCDLCYSDIVRTDLDNRCEKCGLVKGKCDCENNFFHFEGCISPLVNEGSARMAMYRAKFSRKQRNLSYFSKQLALAVRSRYGDIKFDGICYVPMPRAKRMRRGYNQCAVMAYELSKILGVKMLRNALICRKNGGSQHMLSPKRRFDNVRVLYGFKCGNDGKTVLLIDDIKTTGATLDECSRQLLFSGADRVFCATALITDLTDKDNERKERIHNGNRNRN